METLFSYSSSLMYRDSADIKKADLYTAFHNSPVLCDNNNAKESEELVR